MKGGDLLNTPKRRIYDLSVTLLAEALNSIRRVDCVAVEKTTVSYPPIGTVGGAGTPQSALRITLKLEGLTESRNRLLTQIAQKSPRTVVWDVCDANSNIVGQPIVWEMSRFVQNQLIVTVLDHGNNAECVPARLCVDLRGWSNRRFIWEIQNAS